jgi:DivIVA domain-containing protein
VTVFWVVLGIAVLAVVAVVAAGRGRGLSEAEPDRPDVVLPLDRQVTRPDVDQVRFSVGLRGYRMDEVDDVLDRIAADLESRDARIHELEAELRALHTHDQEQGQAHEHDHEQVPIEDLPAIVTPPSADQSDAATARVLVVPIEPSHEPPFEPPSGTQPPGDPRG